MIGKSLLDQFVWNNELTQFGPSDAINETATDEFKQQIFPRRRGGCHGTNQVKRQIVSGVELHGGGAEENCN